MRPSFLIIILLTVAGLIAACGSGAVQSAAAPDRSAATQVSQSQNQTNETIAVNAEPPTGAQPEPAPLVFESQANSEKAVTVEVTPLNLPGGGGPTLDFEVAFNTHSVDLSFDPATISILRDDQGREYAAVAWEGAGPGGHHRSGVLRFEAPETATSFIEVIIHDVAGVPERVFQWNLTQS